MDNFFLILIMTSSLYSQNFNLKNGFIAEGYDAVSYFNNQAVKGNQQFIAEFEGVKFKFSSKENLAVFRENPTKYLPQYGGFCAYAIGKKWKKSEYQSKNF